MSNKILIIEDEPLIARDLKRIVIKNGYQLSSICYNSDNALDVLAKEEYDLILLDINLQGSRNGIELAEIINKKYQKPFIYITSFADNDTIKKVKKTIPAGYILKPFEDREITSSIEIALYKHQTIKESNTPLSLQSINALSTKPVTQRELDIIINISQGMTNRQLAETYTVSQNTIKSHIKNIYQKLNVHSKPELVAKIYES